MQLSPADQLCLKQGRGGSSWFYDPLFHTWRDLVFLRAKAGLFSAFDKPGGTQHKGTEGLWLASPVLTDVCTCPPARHWLESTSPPMLQLSGLLTAETASCSILGVLLQGMERLH